MREIDPANQAALAARRLRARDFLWLVAREYDTGDDVAVGFWSGLTNTEHLVKDVETGDADLRDWYGAGSLISISDIPAVLGIQVHSVRVRMSQLDEQVEEALRLYDCKQAKVEIYRGLFDPETGLLIAPAECRFFGYVDEVEIATPPEGEDGYAELTCKSHTQELLRSNPSTRSHQDQLARDPADMFFVDAAVVGDWGPMQWGPRQETIQTAQPKKEGIFGWGNLFGFL